MTTAAYLISDLHLDESRPGLTDILLRGPARTAPELYLLGDLFEYWIGDDEDAPIAETFASAVRGVSDAGTKVYFMHGNRDFLLGEKYAERCGMTLLADPVVRTIGSIDTLLTHGDRYCTNDAKYMAARAQYRHPQMMQMILAKPIEERRMLAMGLRKQSMEHQKQYGEGTRMDAGDVVDETLIKEMSEKGVHRLIHGHTHRPNTHHIKLLDGSDAERIVLADWRDHGQALEIAADGSYRRQELT
ncbi:MAG: UDP-2,3-diacylglucosamine diphosphatase [Rudaea sp.]